MTGDARVHVAEPRSCAEPDLGPQTEPHARSQPRLERQRVSEPPAQAGRSVEPRAEVEQATRGAELRTEPDRTPTPQGTPVAEAQTTVDRATRAQEPPALSVVIPVHNEAGNIGPLVAEIAGSLAGLLRYEIVYVDDGSTDTTPRELASAQRDHPGVRIVRHRASCGQSTAVRTGVKAAHAPWIVTLDGDGQNDPADIPGMLAARDASGRPDVLVAGVRAARNDRIGKRLGSRFANRLRRWLLKDRARDTGCGIKLFPRAVFLDLPYFDHMHRLPALFIRAGIEPVEHLVNHRPRTRGRSHYGLIDRALVGLVDLLGVAWLQRRARLPVIDTPAAETKDTP